MYNNDTFTPEILYMFTWTKLCTVQHPHNNVLKCWMILMNHAWLLWSFLIPAKWKNSTRQKESGWTNLQGRSFWIKNTLIKYLIYFLSSCQVKGLCSGREEVFSGCVTFQRRCLNIYLKQTNEAIFVYKWNPKVQPSLNEMSSYSSGKEEMGQKMENVI